MNLFTKVLTIAAVVGSLAWGIIHANTSTPVYAANANPAIFFVPHQDDETLSMGASIITHLNAGRNVYVVLVGDGTSTGARERMCNEGVACLTPEQVGEARDREFIAATSKLGVNPNNVIFERQKEGMITIESAGAMYEKYIADPRFGKTASYISMSWLDAHPDHYSLGYALNARCVPQGKGTSTPRLGDCRFYQSAIYQPAVWTGHFPTYEDVATPSGAYYTMTGSNKTRLDNAAQEYYFQNYNESQSLGMTLPMDQRRYGIGWRYSVSDQFNYLKSYPRSWWHKPSTNWNSTTDKANSVDFMMRYQFNRAHAHEH